MKTPPFPRGGHLPAGTLACLLAIGSSSAADSPAAPGGTLTVDHDLARVRGASFQASAPRFLPVEVMWNNNNSSWSRVFHGDHNSGFDRVMPVTFE